MKNVKNKTSMFLLSLILFISLVFVSAFSYPVYADTIDGQFITLSLVNQDPDPALAGNTVEVRLGIENKGNSPFENMVLELIPEYPISMVPGEDNIKNIGTIKSYQTEDNMKIVKFNLKVDRDANAADYELKIKYYEQGKEASAMQKSLNLDVESQESAEVIYIDKSTLIPGKQTDLKFTINNVGNAPLRDLTFKWENEDDIILPVGSDNTKYIKYIDMGGSADLNYKVIADTSADPGLYKLDLSLTYSDPITGEENELSTIAGVYVGGVTDFEVAFSEASAGDTSFSIANIGSTPAYSVSVIIPEQDGWKTTGSNSVIIGNLNNGDYTVASFGLQKKQTKTIDPSQAKSKQQNVKTTEDDAIEFTFDQNANSADLVLIQVAYTDTMGERNVVEKQVKVNTQSLMSATLTDGTAVGPTAFRGKVQQQSFLSKYKWYIIGLILLVVFGIYYHKYKKQKLVNPKFKVKDLFKRK